MPSSNELSQMFSLPAMSWHIQSGLASWKVSPAAILRTVVLEILDWQRMPILELAFVTRRWE